MSGGTFSHRFFPQELKSCREMIMQCFLLEMEVMMLETEVPDTDQNIQSRKNDILLSQLPQVSTPGWGPTTGPQ